MAVPSEQPAQKTFEQLVAEKMPYYQKRVELFEKYWMREQARVEAAKQANVQIQVVMPDGKIRTAVKGVTTPMDIAKEISASLAKKVVVADVDGAAWDLMRPLRGDCALKLHNFEDAEGKDVSADAPSLLPLLTAIGFSSQPLAIALHNSVCKDKHSSPTVAPPAVALGLSSPWASPIACFATSATVSSKPTVHCCVMMGAFFFWRASCRPSGTAAHTCWARPWSWSLAWT